MYSYSGVIPCILIPGLFHVFLFRGYSMYSYSGVIPCILIPEEGPDLSVIVSKDQAGPTDGGRPIFPKFSPFVLYLIRL